jgi:hypothetical protein
MQRRNFERIPANLKSRFICGNLSYYATVKNCSESGLCVTTSAFLPCGNEVEVHIPLKKDVLKLSAIIVRLLKIDDFNYTFGIELADPPESYLEFIDTLRNVYETFNDFSIKWFIPTFYQ